MNIPPDPVQQIIAAFHGAYYMQTMIDKEYDEAMKPHQEPDEWPEKSKPEEKALQPPQRS